MDEFHPADEPVEPALPSQQAPGQQPAQQPHHQVHPQHAQQQYSPPQHQWTGPADQKQTFWTRIVAFYKECIRVFKVTKKPDKQEFLTVVKISGAGILIIGAIGFIIHITQQLLFK